MFGQRPIQSSHVELKPSVELSYGEHKTVILDIELIYIIIILIPSVHVCIYPLDFSVHGVRQIRESVRVREG